MDSKDHQETAGGSSGRIVVKLKFPKMLPEEEVVVVKTESPAAEAAAVPVSDEAAKTHSCKECGRIFSSGKALGGHMSSAHVQANNKDLSGKKLMMKTKSGNKSGCSSSFSDHICVLCAKTFPSKKSLFGHMRCHPERPHRGMDPPPPSGHLKTNSDEFDDSSDDDDQSDSLAASLKSWPTAAKRYRGGPARPAPDSPDPLSSYATDDSLLATAHELVKLSLIQQIPLKSSGGTSSLTITRRNNYTIPDFSDDFGGDHRRFKKLKICERDDNNYSSSPRKVDQYCDGKGKQKASSNDLVDSDEIDSDDETCLMAMNDLMNVKRVTESSSKAAPLPPTSPPPPPAGKMIIIQENGNSSISTPQKYTCDVCHRSFKSHQALGGHRSSHNKFKFTVVNTDDLGENGVKTVKKESEYEQARYSYGTRVENHDENSSYVCEVCKKIFASGQALGGHKRSHSASSSSNSSSPAKAAAAEEVKAAAAEEEEENKKLNGQKNVFDFDLNESPDQELENGGDEVPVLYYNDAA